MCLPEGLGDCTVISSRFKVDTTIGPPRTGGGISTGDWAERDNGNNAAMKNKGSLIFDDLFLGIKLPCEIA
jgi:hypothetical protein